MDGYRLFVTGFSSSLERDVDDFLQAEYGCKDVWPEGGGLVAELNDPLADYQLAEIRDKLEAQFVDTRFDVRYWDQGEGDMYPAYDDAPSRGAIRTIDIRGIPYDLVNQVSADDIAKQVFSQYDPLEARAYQSAQVIQITFRQALSAPDIRQMEDDLVNELLRRKKEWGKNVTVTQNQDHYPTPGRIDRPDRAHATDRPPYHGRKRRRPRSADNICYVIGAILMVMVLGLLLFWLFAPERYCERLGSAPLIGCDQLSGDPTPAIFRWPRSDCATMAKTVEKLTKDLETGKKSGGQLQKMVQQKEIEIEKLRMRLRNCPQDLRSPIPDPTPVPIRPGDGHHGTPAPGPTPVNGQDFSLLCLDGHNRIVGLFPCA